MNWDYGVILAPGFPHIDLIFIPLSSATYLYLTAVFIFLHLHFLSYFRHQTSWKNSTEFVQNGLLIQCKPRICMRGITGDIKHSQTATHNFNMVYSYNCLMCGKNLYMMLLLLSLIFFCSFTIQNKDNMMINSPLCLVKFNIVPCLSRKRGLVRPSVCHKNFNLAHIFWGINDRALIFGMHDSCDKSFQLTAYRYSDLWPTSSFRSKLMPGGGPQFSEFACCLVHFGIHRINIELLYICVCFVMGIHGGFG